MNTVRVNKKIAVNKDLTTQVLVSVKKDAQGGYTPMVTLGQTVNATTGIPASTIRTTTVTGTTIPSGDIDKGISLNFIADFKTATGNFSVNNATQAINAIWETNTTVPSALLTINGQNQLGGAINSFQNLSFDLCYFNYTLSPYGDTASSQTFHFEDVANTTNTKSETGLVMAITPVVKRTLTGPCMPDTDKDGILDIYEDLNQDNNLADNDTDQDGTPNYLESDDDGDGVNTVFEGATANGANSLDTDSDAIPNYLDNDDDGDGLYTLYEGANPDGDFNPTTGQTLNTDNYTNKNRNIIIETIPNYLDNDDDGDGVLTLYEGADPDGNYNPLTGTESLNTDGIAGNNPNMKIDVIPNYLDSDDDGDGYQTWEESATADGLNALDTDTDGIPDYLDYKDVVFAAAQAVIVNNYVNLAGDKYYELSNHLGNVLAVVSDKKIPQFNTDDVPSSGLKVFSPEVLSYSDYDPFGMLVPNRHGNSIPNGYRYGFNGKENDNEIMGEGNFQDYGMRMYNPRIGRFFNPDPIIVKDHKYPELSTYQFAGNTPIQAVDLDGLEGTVYINLVKEPTGFSKVLYASALKQRLIDNGAHPKTEVKYVQDLTIIETLVRFLGQGEQDIEVQIRNYSKRNNDPVEAGGYSNKKIKGIVTVYNGLTTDSDPSKSEVPVDLYVNATLHEIGHNLFDFNHDANGNTTDGEGLMDYDHAYEKGAEYSTAQKKSIYNKIGFGNKDNPLPDTKKEKETQKKQLNEINEKPKQTNEKPKKVKA